MKFLDIYNQDKKLLKQIKKDIELIIKDTSFILGDKVKEFENRYAKYCNTKYAVGCANGTDALYLAIKSLDLPKNSEVILPAMTYCSTLFSIIRSGLKPILVDISNNKSTICVNSLKKKINKKTKLIIMVHLYGEPCDYFEIKKLIQNKNIFLIEDAAQAHGAYLSKNNKKILAGSMSDIGCFSFYPGKNLGAYGDAGIITTNKKRVYDSLIKLRNLGSKKKFIHSEVGYNSRLDTIQASVLLNKLKNLNQLNLKRKKIAKIYNEKIYNNKLTKLSTSEGCVFHQYVILANNPKKFRKYLEKKGIPYGRHYPYPLHKLHAVKKMFKNQKYIYSEKLATNGTSLPISPMLNNKQIKKVVKVLNNFS